MFESNGKWYTKLGGILALVVLSPLLLVLGVVLLFPQGRRAFDRLVARAHAHA